MAPYQSAEPEGSSCHQPPTTSSACSMPVLHRMGHVTLLLSSPPKILQASRLGARLRSQRHSFCNKLLASLGNSPTRPTPPSGLADKMTGQSGQSLPGHGSSGWMRLLQLLHQLRLFLLLSFRSPCSCSSQSANSLQMPMQLPMCLFP